MAGHIPVPELVEGESGFGDSLQTSAATSRSRHMSEQSSGSLATDLITTGVMA